MRSTLFLLTVCSLFINCRSQDSQIEFEMASKPRNVSAGGYSKKIKSALGDTAIVFWETNFYNCRAAVGVNGKITSKEVISSDMSTSLAWTPKIGVTTKIRTITIHINDTSYSFPYQKGYRYYFVNMSKNKVRIEFADEIPIYD